MSTKDELKFAGDNGAQTSREIANFALANGLSAANMAYATSQNFPDALAFSKDLFNQLPK